MEFQESGGPDLIPTSSVDQGTPLAAKRTAILPRISSKDPRMPSLSRKWLILAVLLLSASFQPIAFAQRCSGAPGCARTSSTAANASFLGGLKGQYAFMLKGTLTAPGIASRATVAVGSFTADGQGDITSGEMDFTSAAETFQALPIAGNYTLDNYGVGTLNLASAQGTESFAFYTTGDLSYLTTYASGSLVETDNGGPVVSSGSFYQQASNVEVPMAVTGSWQLALTGETFVSEGTPSPIFVGGSLSLDVPFSVASFFSGIQRVGAGASENINGTLLTGQYDTDSCGRMSFYAVPLGSSYTLAGYVVDSEHILIVSTNSPQVAPLLSGIILRAPNPSQY